MKSNPELTTNIDLFNSNNATEKTQAKSQIENYFSSYIDSKTTDIFVLNKTGTVVTYDGISSTLVGIDFSQRNYFMGAMSINSVSSSVLTDKVFQDEIFYSTVVNRYVFTLSTVIRSNTTNNIAGVLAFGLNVPYMYDLLAPRTNSGTALDSYYNASGLGTTGESFIINDQGSATSRSRFILQDNNFIFASNFTNDQGYKNAVKYGYYFGESIDYRNQTVYASYLYLGTQPSGVDNRYTWLKDKLSVNLPWVLVVKIDKSEILSHLDGIVAQQTTNNILLFCILIISGIITTLFALYLANTIAKPITNLSIISKAISTGDLTVKVSESQNTDEIGHLQNSFKTMIEFLRPSVESISRQANILASSSQEMASSSEEANASSEELSSVSQQISKGAQSQSEILNKTLKQMEAMQKKFSDKIGGIKVTSELIETISNQVNMLALNASIEAARAGEYGGGFAVVADNIRRLADDTKSSVYRVNTIIDDLTTSIAKSMNDVSTSVISVTTVAEETSAGAEEASAATEEQAATMQ